MHGINNLIYVSYKNIWLPGLYGRVREHTTLFNKCSVLKISFTEIDRLGKLKEYSLKHRELERPIPAQPKPQSCGLGQAPLQLDFSFVICGMVSLSPS